VLSGCLVESAVVDDQEDTAIAALVQAHEFETWRRPSDALEPAKGGTCLFYWSPPAALDGVEKSIRKGVCDQLSPQIRLLMTAMKVPAPAAATPLRKDSFFETRTMNVVIF
jgi:hypothetical protein